MKFIKYLVLLLITYNTTAQVVVDGDNNSCCGTEDVDFELREVCIISPSAINGINGYRWDSELNASPHAFVGDIFTDAKTHINGVHDEYALITDSWNLNDLDFPITGAIESGDVDISSQELYTAVIYVDQPMLLNDNNGNTGESIRFYQSDCNGELLAIDQTLGNTAGTVNGLQDITHIMPGFYEIAIQISDYSVYGGFNLRYSIDNGVTYSPFPINQTFTTYPKLDKLELMCFADGRITLKDGITPFTGSIVECNFTCAPLPREPLPDIEIVVVDGCDDIDGDPANYVNITRETIILNSESTTTFWTNYGDDTNQTEYPTDPNFVDCATGEPLGEPPVIPDCEDVEYVYAYAPQGTQGVNVERWTTNASTGNPSTATALDFFNGIVDYSGMPSHINGNPDTYTLESDLNIIDGNNAQDQWRYWTYLYTTQPIRLRDRSAYAEQVEYYVGECDGAPVNVDNSTYPGTDQNDLLDISLDAGRHFIGGLVYDFSAWSGVRYQYSTDNGVTWLNVPASWLYAENPTIAQCLVKACINQSGAALLTDSETGELLGSEFTTKVPDLCSSVPISASEPQCAPQTYYNLVGGENGTNIEYWGENALQPPLTETGSITEAFSNSNFFSHINGNSNGSGSWNSWTISSTQAATTTGAVETSEDEFLIWSYIYLPYATDLREINSNTGEAMDLWVGECCTSPKPLYNNNGDITPLSGGGQTSGLFGNSNNTNPVLRLSAGVHWLGMRVRDNGAVSGVQLQYLRDDAVWANFPTSWTFIDKPFIEESKGWYCEDGNYWNIDKTNKINVDDPLISCNAFDCSINNYYNETECQLFNYYEVEGITNTLYNNEWSDVLGTGATIPNANRNKDWYNDFINNWDETQATTTTSDWITLSTNDTDDTGLITDLQIINGYIVITDHTTLRWTGGSEGYTRIDVGICNGPLETKACYYHPPSAATTGESVISLPPGIHSIKIYNLDVGGTSSSQTVQYTLDGDNWTNGAGPNVSISKIHPNEVCLQGYICDDTYYALDKVSVLNNPFICSIACNANSANANTSNSIANTSNFVIPDGGDFSSTTPAILPTFVRDLTVCHVSGNAGVDISFDGGTTFAYNLNNTTGESCRTLEGVINTNNLVIQGANNGVNFQLHYIR